MGDAELETSTNSSESVDVHTISVHNLYSALIKCFGIIILGFIAGRMKIISNNETKGLNTFVGTFALPCLIFLSLVELDWHVVNWNFLLAILISKGIVFFCVLIISLLIAKPINYGRAGILAIFCTQSNDFAIGYPIVVALYQQIHPEYASYLYLMAPISLAILNPIGYILLEIDKKIKEKREENNVEIPVCSAVQNTTNVLSGKFLMIVKIIESICFNPILMMTILGVIGGMIFPSGLPEILTGVLKSFGDSFSATALFLLGLRIVGQGEKFRGSGLLIPGVLILIKLLALPLVTRQTINIIQAGANLTETTELSTFGFLYGTFPAAPGAFVVASRYNVDVDMIASSMVACTFISAPLIYISAKMISLSNLKPEDYIYELDQFSFDICVTGIIACAWVLLLFIMTKRCSLMPHRITTCLLISQLICCIGVILRSKLNNPNKWVSYMEFFIFNVGAYSSRLWTAILAATILFLQCRSLCFILRMWPYMLISAWGIPVFVSVLIILIDESNVSGNEKKNPNFAYGNTQAAIFVFLLVMCFIVTVGCLVLHQRYKRRFEKYLTLSKELCHPESEIITSENSQEIFLNNNDENLSGEDNLERQRENNERTVIQHCVGERLMDCNNSIDLSEAVVDIEDLLVKNDDEEFLSSNDVLRRRNTLCSSSYDCGSRQNCQNLIDGYKKQRRDCEPIEDPDESDEYQILNYVVLLILLSCCMFVSLALSVWTLVMEGMSGIYLELSFFDTFLNFGQGIIIFAVFITDTAEVFLSCARYWRKIWYGADVLTLPDWNSLNIEVKFLCEQFRKHHLEKCKLKIAKDRRWRVKIYKKVFYGNELVDWLLEVGLAGDRLEATNYGRYLVDGRILRHVNNVYHFHDKKLLYTFCCKA